ncbi:UNVERIFIED_CONTAM: Disease resistance protein RPM1 [Sesamum latifolium]|uniref:Disease resistance protein RPM1 n=1 Tax=Sesamum latifolium TaxID=2727402 RepID=A0AAW2XBD2_9LAMI
MALSQPTIVVIGGLLSKSNNTREYWEFVAENITSFVNSGDDEYCLNILSLSYNSLPIHLKPCFLYMRVFPKDDEIEASKLIKLWIGEGFLKPVRGKSLKEVAKEYLKDLADRNLILIRKWTRTEKIKTCSVHDILRELCFREFKREHLIRVPKAQKILVSVLWEDDVCFLCSYKLGKQNKIHLQEVLVGLQSTTNLQSLDLGDLGDTFSLPEIWEMPKLSEEVVKRLPNLKKLSVRWWFSGDYSLAQLNKLESFSLRYFGFHLEDIAFPTSLTKLSLWYCKFLWKNMMIIGSSLPNLEVLRLYYSFKGQEWSPIEGEFLRLKVLAIYGTDLEQWRAEDIHFSNLHGLYLDDVRKLKEIPLSIGDINTLQSIHLKFCSYSANNSAVEILKDQKEKGNENLQVYVEKK